MLPTQRTSRTQGRNRRGHNALPLRQPVKCPNCGSAKRPHAACRDCGYVRPGLKLELNKEE